MKKRSKDNHFLENVYNTNVGRWCWSILMSIVLFLITSILCNRVFYTNDDENVMYTLAGYYTGGEPYDHHFINVILSKVIRLFYDINGSIPWYPLMHIFVLWLSTVVLYACTIEVCNKKNVNFIIANIIGIVGYFGIIFYVSTLLQFTTTSACAGGAATILILTIGFKDDNKSEVVVKSIFSVFLLLICYMIRKNSGAVAFCFYFSTVVYKYIEYYVQKNKPKNSNAKYFSIIIAIGIICVIGATVANSIVRSGPEWDKFFSFENARYKMTDYPHDTFDENPELYEGIDWSKELYLLAGQHWWFFMDEKINQNSFEEISETGKDNISLEELNLNFNKLFSDNKITTFYLIGAVGLIVIYLIMIIIRKNREPLKVLESLFFLCMFFGGVVLCLYLCIKGRFIQRAFHSIVIPYMFIAVYLLLNALKDSYDKSYKRIVNNMLILCLCIFVSKGVYDVSQVAKLEVAERIEKSQNTLYIESYAMQHKENVYIYDTSLTFRYMPFIIYNGNYPDNLFFWGGMGWNSPAFNKQLSINGLTELYSDVLLRDNVYFITKDDYMVGGKKMIIRFCNYMVAEYEGISLEEVERLVNNIVVYKFSTTKEINNE